MRYATVLLLLFLVVGSIGCGPSDEFLYYRYQYETRCENMARNYRDGNYRWVDFNHMGGYFKYRVGKMTAAELRGLLGEPRVVTPKDCYYGDALWCVYGDVVLDEDNWDGYDKHDQVLHYGEGGPPEHSIPDESSNLFFVLKDNVVVGVWTALQ